jgi:hypothetical protein
VRDDIGASAASAGCTGTGLVCASEKTSVLQQPEDAVIPCALGASASQHESVEDAVSKSTLTAVEPETSQ